MSQKAKNLIHLELLNSPELQPLQQLAAVRVSIPICESEDVQCMIRNFSKIIGHSSEAFSDDQWKQLCDKVRNKLEQISVPKIIIEIVLEKMWPISFEISKWIQAHDADMGIDSASKFCWTPLMNINYEETAEILIQTETIAIENRFEMACFYCLESKVRSLWEMMSLSEKRSFSVTEDFQLYMDRIVLYWCYYIQDVLIENKALDSTQLFKYSVQNGYLYAAKFFLGKLKKQYRNRMVLNCFNSYLHKLEPYGIVKTSHYATAFFLMGELNSEIRGLLFIFILRLVFRHFLEWPLQQHFMAVVDRLRRYTEHPTFYYLLEEIFVKEISGFKDYDYKKLFMEFWLQGTEVDKTFVSDRSIGFKIFFRFVKKHFGFVFDESSFSLKAKFRAIVLQRQISEPVVPFEKENVEFFRFLLLERVTTKASMERSINYSITNYPFNVCGVSFHNLPLGELMYLIDGILGMV